MSRTESIRYTARDSFIRRTIAGNDVLIPVGGRIADFNGIIELNGTAALIWEHLQKPVTREELTAFLQEECEDAPPQIQEDLDEFLQLLLGHKMIEEL